MPLYNDLEVRPRLARGSILPSYAPEGARRLEAEPVDMREIIGEAALSGALSSVPLAPTYEGLQAGVGEWGRKWAQDPLAADRGRLGAAFASDNPYVASSYAGPKGKVHPFRIYPDELVEIRHGGWGERMVRPTDSRWQDTTHLWKPAPEGPVSALDYKDVALPYEAITRDPGNFPRRAGPLWDNFVDNWPEGFSAASRDLPPGRAHVLRDIVDPGGYDAYWHGGGVASSDPLAAATLPSEQWAYTKGTRVVPAGAPLSGKDLGDLARGHLRHLGPPGHPPHPADAARVVSATINDPRFGTGEGRLLFRGLSSGAEAHPPLPQRAAGALKSAGKGLLKGLTPVALLEGALLAGPVSGLAGGAGYASESPDSAGLFSPPGPGYEGLVTPEDIIAVAEQKEEKREARRVALLQEAIDLEGVEAVRELARERGVLRHQLRAEDLAQLLGPVR